MKSTSINWKDRIKALGAGTVMALSCLSSPVQADDSEVFFGQVDSSIKIFPNVLFVLDTSGSMNWYDSGEPLNRITRMKDALNLILDSATNVNVGIMRFNGSSGGGPVLFPVTYIDEEVCTTDNCGLVNLVDRISASSDDAEDAGSSAYIDGNIMNMGDVESSNHTIGLRFDNLNIPSGVTITSAVVDFVAKSDYSGNPTLTIKAHDVDDSETFTNVGGNISGRPVTTGVNWTPGNWTQDEVYQTPDLSGLVQSIVNRTGWCGGNSLSFIVTGTGGERGGVSFDNHPNHAATLKLTYDSTSIASGMGCSQKTVVASVAASSDDAEERKSNKRMDVGSTDLELGSDWGGPQMVGMRFRKLAIPKGATITNAEIEFQVDEYKTGNVSLQISGHDTNSGWWFWNSKRNISNRWKTAAKVDWVNPPTPGVGQKLVSPDLSPIVQEIVNRSGWKPNYNMVFLVDHVSGTGRRTVESYNGYRTAAPKLRVSYQVNVAASADVTYVTAREKMKQIVNNLTATGGTPIVDAMYEAALYYNGEEVDYGTSRGPWGNRYHRVSSPSTYTGGLVTRLPGCSDADLDNSSCSSEEITTGPEGPPTYISPLESSCQTNHIVLLSDGEPTSNSSASKVRSMIGVSSCEQTGSRACGKELTDWLVQNDHSTSVLGKQYISTYTIGLNLNSAFLEDLAGATVNQFNRLTHRNDIYFSLFKPKERPLWDGNLKKYQLKLASDDIVRLFDNSTPPKLAVDQASGFFADGTKSFWSPSADGNAVASGGMTSQLSLTATGSTAPRKVYTYTGTAAADDAQLNLPVNRLHENNGSLISKAALGMPSATDAEHSDILKWARGVDVLDFDNDNDKTEVRMQMGDPMHSRPLIINYASTSDAGDSTIYVATNQGFLHAITHTTGEELFTFMPQELWPNLKTFYENKSSERHPYGLDGTVSSWLSDENNNTVVDSGEDAFLYMGMRRGGKNYYAMDVSNRNNPKLKWVIKGGAGGTSGFSHLGETWSKMIPAKVRIGSSIRNVLVFAGGYDTNQDYDEDGLLTTRREDTVGRAIYMVDSDTGEKLWSGSGYSGGTGGTGSHKYFNKMKYSIPSDIRLIDIDFDGLLDQMWVGDMGGQVWRFDVNNHNPSNPLVKGGVMAEFAEDDDPKKNRRFYYEPDVSLMSQYGQKFLAVSIGSGWRARPLGTAVEDRIYMFRSNDVYNAPSGYGIVDTVSDPTASFSTITESDLADVTDNMDTPVSFSSVAGWMLKMTRAGEKILANSITVDGQLIFTSYVPMQATEACTTAIGGGRVYVLDVLNGQAALNLDEQGADHELTEDDRSKELAHGGIPPEPAALITEEGDPVILVGPEQPLDDLEFGNLTNRTYWREEDLSDTQPAAQVAAGTETE